MDEDINALTWGMFIFEELLYHYKDDKNGRLARVSNLPKVTQLMSDRARAGN